MLILTFIHFPITCLAATVVVVVAKERLVLVKKKKNSDNGISKKKWLDILWI